MSSNNPEWEGYTLDEIRFTRQLNNARIELATHKLKKEAEPYSSPSRAAVTVFDRVLKAMSYIDYIVFGYRAIKLIRRWFSK